MWAEENGKGKLKQDRVDENGAADCLVAQVLGAVGVPVGGLWVGRLDPCS